MTNGGSTRPRLLYFITEDWFFCSHFLGRARAAAAAGFEVSVLCRVRDHGDAIQREGFELFALDIHRGRVAPVRDLALVNRIARVYREHRPDVVHQIAAKPIIYGSLAARIVGLSPLVNAPVGMGFVFSSGRWMAQLLRPVVLFAYRAFLDPPGGYVVLENRDDRDWLIRERIVRADRAVLIRGAGVDPERFFPGEEEWPPMVVMVARLLSDKGIAEFVEAAHRLREQGRRARFIVVGDADKDNPGCVPAEQIAAWKRRGVVEFWGWRDDVSEIYRRAAIACLPSYREGLPKVLLEAAACGLPIVATDVPGCREIVKGGVNGDLVPPRDASSLAASLDVLLSQPDRRRQFGHQSRRFVMEHFTEKTIADLTVGLYRRVLLEARQTGRSRG